MQVENKKGFTLIELSLSMVFIGILSLTIAYIINDTIGTYRRGVTLNQVNTAAIGLVDDMRAAVQNSSTKSIKDDCAIVYSDDGAREKCEGDGARSFAYVGNVGKVILKNGEELSDVPVSGAFCTGTYSYIWNSGYFFNDEVVVEINALRAKYKNGDVEMDDFRLLKIRDEFRSICTSAAGDDYRNTGGNVFDVSGRMYETNEEPIDLLSSDEINGGLALYELYVAPPAESMANSSIFYSVSFVLGTIQGGINITKSGGFCATPDEYEIENFNYCAINKFNFAAEAAGGK